MMSLKLCMGIFALFGLAQADRTFSVEHLLAATTATTSQKPYLRASSTTATRGASEKKTKRQLQSIFNIPYALVWRVTIGNGFPEADRAPTSDEYEGVRVATVEWFNAAIADHYNDSAVSFVEAECELREDGTSWEASPPDNYPHKILMHCEAFFSADTVDGIPTINDFILDINTDYDFGDFVQNYLWNASPETNLFQFSQRVGYTLSDNGAIGGGTTDPAVPTAPTEAPVAPPSVPTPGLTGRYVLPFAIAYNLALFEESTDRQPTEAEYDGIRNETIGWLTDSMEEYYADETSFSLEQVIVNVGDTSYSPDLQFPYVIQLEAFPIFTANALSDLPTVIQLLTIISQEFDASSLIEDYFQTANPEDNLFRDTAQLQYSTGTTTPAGPVGTGTPSITPSPAPQATTPPVATNAPVTAAPVTAAPIFTSTPAPATMAPVTTSTPVMAPTATTSAPVMPTTAPTSAPVMPPTAPPSAPVMPPTATTSAPATDFETLPPLTGTVVETNINWDMEIGFGIPDRMPRMDEYDGYRMATEAFLTDIYASFYNANVATPNVMEVQVSLLSASYNPSMMPTHQVTTKVEVLFDGDAAAAPAEIDLLEVLRDANLMDFMLNYLHQTTVPIFSIFIGVRSVAWEATTAPVSTMEMPSMPSSSAPVSASTSQAPVPSPTMPTPSPAPAPTSNTANLTALVTVPVTMTWELAINTDMYTGAMEPTEEEYNGLLLAAKKFLTDSMNNVFASQPETDFVGLVDTMWVATKYTPGETLPYSGEMQFSIAFMEGSALLSGTSAYWEVINSLDFSEFIPSYLWLAYPGDSIFHFTNYVQWNYINNA